MSRVTRECRWRSVVVSLALFSMALMEISVSRRSLYVSKGRLLYLEQKPEKRRRRLGVVNLVDANAGKKYMWAIYSIHNQMRRFNMLESVEHVVLVAKDLDSEYIDLLREWLGQEQVREIDLSRVRQRVADDGLWKETFSKIEAFNMTEFDKLIVLDNDILIRKSLLHWFDYPAPAATHARGTMEFNSGAMVIEPSTDVYQKLFDHVPRSRTWDPNTNKGNDTWNSGWGDQGFVSAFFTSNATNYTMHTMPYGSSVLSSDLDLISENAYFWRYRNHLIDAVHFTLHKPWRNETASSNPVVCDALQEWLESIESGAPENELQILRKDLLRDCPEVNVTINSSDTSTTNEEAASSNECMIPPGMKVRNATNRQGEKLFSMVVLGGSHNVSKSIRHKGYWEIDSVEQIADLANATLPPPSSGAFYDVGANIGFYSLLFAHAGYKVVAFEPLSLYADALRASLCLNPSFDVVLIQQGVSDEIATCRLAKRDEKYVVGSITCHAPGEDLSPCDDCEKVDVTTLDQHSAERPDLPNQIALLKMDIGKRQTKVAKGAHHLLKQRPPALVLFENSNPSQALLANTLAKRYNYTIGTKKDRAGRSIASYLGPTKSVSKL